MLLLSIEAFLTKQQLEFAKDKTRDKRAEQKLLFTSAYYFGKDFQCYICSKKVLS